VLCIIFPEHQPSNAAFGSLEGITLAAAKLAEWKDVISNVCLTRLCAAAGAAGTKVAH